MQSLKQPIKVMKILQSRDLLFGDFGRLVIALGGHPRSIAGQFKTGKLGEC